MYIHLTIHVFFLQMMGSRHVIPQRLAPAPLGKYLAVHSPFEEHSPSIVFWVGPNPLSQLASFFMTLILRYHVIPPISKAPILKATVHFLQPYKLTTCHTMPLKLATAGVLLPVTL